MRPFKQLVSVGVLATLRQYPYRVGQLVKVRHRGTYIGMAVVEYVGETGKVLLVSKDSVDRLVRLSGFNTLDEWLEEAKKLNKGLIPKYVVIIRLVKRGRK